MAVIVLKPALVAVVFVAANSAKLEQPQMDADKRR